MYLSDWRGKGRCKKEIVDDNIKGRFYIQQTERNTKSIPKLYDNMLLE